MKKQIIIALATLTALPAVSQEKWDLRKCSYRTQPEYQATGSCKRSECSGFEYC